MYATLQEYERHVGITKAFSKYKRIDAGTYRVVPNCVIAFLAGFRGDLKTEEIIEALNKEEN